MIYCLIGSNFKRSYEITLILRGIDPYSLLYSLIRDYLIKLMSLVIILTLDPVFSMNSQTRFVKSSNSLATRDRCLDFNFFFIDRLFYGFFNCLKIL